MNNDRIYAFLLGLLVGVLTTVIIVDRILEPITTEQTRLIDELEKLLKERNIG
jgi:hypothetical protein